MNEETIKTIRYALNLLMDFNKSINRITKSRVRDIERDEKAIADFEAWVLRLRKW